MFCVLKQITCSRTCLHNEVPIQPINQCQFIKLALLINKFQTVFIKQFVALPFFHRILRGNTSMIAVKIIVLVL